jgi:hypothetical protein
MTILLGLSLVVSGFAGILVGTELRALHRRLDHEQKERERMSQTIDRMEAALTAVEAEVAQLKATPPADPNAVPAATVDGWSARLEALAPATVPAPPPAAE